MMGELGDVGQIGRVSLLEVCLELEDCVSAQYPEVVDSRPQEASDSKEESAETLTMG